MNIYIFSDESGVFDRKHNDVFVFAGLIILGSEEKLKWERMYLAAERSISSNYEKGIELKATKITNKDKSKLFRSLNNCYKFSVVINEKAVHERIFESKKDKQRYLDYVYKIAVKRAISNLISENRIIPDDVQNIYFFVDEHTTATNGKYELRESLENEFKNGTFNSTWQIFFPPLFPRLPSVELEFCNSSSKRLIRSADIVANRVYFLARKDKYNEIESIDNLHNVYMP